MEPPAEDKLGGSGSNEIEHDGSILSSETYSWKNSLQRNLYMLGIMYSFSSQSSYLWRNTLKHHHSLLFVFIASISITIGTSLLNIRFPRNLGLNIVLVLSLAGSIFSVYCCIPDTEFTVLFYAISNAAFVCSTMCLSTQKLPDSTQNSGLVAATVSTFHSALLYFLYNLQNEAIQKICITILLLLMSILLIMSRVCRSSKSENMLRYGSPIISCFGALGHILEGIKLQMDFSFISSVCISVVLSVCIVMGSYEISRRDFERFEKSFVNPNLALFTVLLFAVTAAATGLSYIQ